MIKQEKNAASAAVKVMPDVGAFEKDARTAGVMWGLTSKEAEILGLLLTHKTMRRTELFDAMYGAKLPKDRPAQSAITAYVSFIRKKLGLTIHSKWDGESIYYLDDGDKVELRRAIALMLGDDDGADEIVH